MTPAQAFPRLNPSNHHVTSPASPDHNCIAWSAGDTEHWWQPNIFWPIQASPNEYGIAVLQQLFMALGYQDCAMDFQLELGFEKVALFGDPVFYTHAARQLPSGKWTSKLGHAEDIEHEAPQDVAGGIYGDLVQVMKRPMSGTAS